MKKPENQELLDKLIVGRVEPHIYAFSTNTIPNYLKVGDTYRPVLVRLDEWKRYFPNLKKVYENTATINENIFFRDYSVHQFLEKDLQKQRLSRTEHPDIYYSNEFFKDVSVDHLEAAVADICSNYTHNTGKYKYYDANNRLPETFSYASTGEWKMRPNQEDTVKRFMKAVDSGHTNLLMYAVMRFGKSFTSLCCAKAKGYKVVLIVSAKADVKEEWKKTVQSADNFNKDYVFISSQELLKDKTIVTSTLATGKGVIIFLTLQDLQGNEIKDKHEDLFNNKIDLLIVDETHYGARAESYGQIVRSAKDDKDRHANDDFIEIKDAEDQIKSLNVKVTLHLSGTPYRILMGSEFSKDDIIAFYQFTDIVKAQEEWDQEHLLKDTDDVKEWDNPYFGFPQMIRFAFVPSKSALALLESLKSDGSTYAFSSLFEPQSLTRDSKKHTHKKFVYEKEVLEFFEAIDGSKDDEGLLSFLDYDKIKEGKLCQHIVCVLPYCASCDALENLINSNIDKFKNLKNYTIINISGVDSPDEYRTTEDVKSKIKECALEEKKTLTLTVNRMLTGSTVEEWDTMIFLKNTASPQEYDQAVFRLQNPYIREYREPNGDVIKFNMKPQTLLVDFDPHRMFVMQEQKSQIYNANIDASGNKHLRDRLEEELRISPIIRLNKNKVEQVEAVNILSEVSKYSNSRGVLDETRDIPVDLSLLNLEEIKKVIDIQAELGKHQGLSLEAHKGTGSDLDDPNEDGSSKDTPGKTGNKEAQSSNESSSESKDRIKSLENKFRTYYSRILFFSFLTKSSVSSLEDILMEIDDEENLRIATHLNIDKETLTLIKTHMNVFVLRQLDYKIQNINTLAHDETVDPMQRAMVAIKKFDRISDSEITTPEFIADDMLNLIPDECFSELKNTDSYILDIASKMGEFAVSIIKRCYRLGISISDIKDKILSIPTSPIAYEFTRKVYEILGLNIECIATKFNSYDLLNVKTSNKDDKIDYKKIYSILSQNKSMSCISLSDKCGDLKENHKMKFNAVVGNPPYQEADGGAAASARPIYPYFVDASKKLSPSYLTIIIPSRWYTGGKHLNKFRQSMLNDTHIRELHDCLHPEEIFPDTNNRGGLCYFLWDYSYNNESDDKMKVITHKGEGKTIESIRALKTRDLDIFLRNSAALSILDKVVPDNKTDVMSNHISPRCPFGLAGNFVKSAEFQSTEQGLEEPIKCYAKAKSVGYIKKAFVSKHQEWIDCWKVLMPYANNIGTELPDDNQNTFLGEPNSVCTETYLVAGADMDLTENSAQHLSNYLKTKFARFLHSLAKTSHHGTRKTYRFVPIVDFSEDWTDEKLYSKFNLTQDEISMIENSIKPMK